jgi:hypothetical protein
MLFIFSLILGFNINVAYDMLRKLENVSSVFEELTDVEMRDRFREIFALYHKHFEQKERPLKDWANQSIASIYKDMRQGFISLPRELAASEIGKVYPLAQTNIVATNVGDTEFYFNSDSPYPTSNKNARDRGIPIIRFYLFSKDQKIELHSPALRGQKATIDSFYQDIKLLHDSLGSLYSVVIDADKLKEVRDFLLMDNRFLAETVMTHTGERSRAKATESQERLAEARDYFRDLRGIASTSKYIWAMSNDQVKKYYHKYENEPSSGEGHLARRLYEEIMDGITGKL